MVTTTATTEQDSQNAVLLPIFLRLGADLTGINVQLEGALAKLNRAIKAAESLDPSYPALPLLRAKRSQLMRFQASLLQTEQKFQDEAIALEDGYAANSGLGSMDWLTKLS